MKEVYLGLVGLVLIVAMVDCKQDSALMSEPENESKTPTEGSVVYSELLKDNQLIELCVDSIVNLGDTEHPAYFYVNLSHTIFNSPVENEQTNTNSAFYAVTFNDLEEFISIYAEAQTLGGGAAMTNEQKQSAYHHFYNFLMENNIDAAQLVSMTLQNPSILKPTLESGTIVPAKGPDDYDPVLPEVPIILPDPPSGPIYRVTDDAVLDSILSHIVLLRDGLILPYNIHSENDSLKNVAEGPDPYNENTYVSYINDGNHDSRHYYDTQTFQSPIYTCRYGTKGCPMVESEFYIEGWYASKLKGDTKNILYVPYLKTIIKNIHVGATMHLEGNVTYTQPDIRRLENEEFPVIGGGEIVVNYGDGWLVKRVGRLKFTVDGKTGFKENSWNSNE